MKFGIGQAITRREDDRLLTGQGRFVDDLGEPGVNVEFVSAKPTGPMHVGHGRNAVVGDGVASLLAWSGHQVTREYYVNDHGAQVQTLARSVHLRYQELFGRAVEMPPRSYPGEYVKDVARALRDEWAALARRAGGGLARPVPRPGGGPRPRAHPRRSGRGRHRVRRVDVGAQALPVGDGGGLPGRAGAQGPRLPGKAPAAEVEEGAARPGAERGGGRRGRGPHALPLLALRRPGGPPGEEGRRDPHLLLRRHRLPLGQAPARRRPGERPRGGPRRLRAAPRGLAGGPGRLAPRPARGPHPDGEPHPRRRGGEDVRARRHGGLAARGGGGGGARRHPLHLPHPPLRRPARLRPGAGHKADPGQPRLLRAVRSRPPGPDPREDRRGGHPRAALRPRGAGSEMPKIGRAFLDDLVDQATAEGEFGKAAGIFREWQKMGPQTKAILFQDRAHIKALDNFFLLAKKIGENPNPSGTARVATALNVVSGALGYPASKLFYTPAGVRLLTEGLRLPATGPRTQAWLAKVKAAGPAVAQSIPRLSSPMPSEAAGRP